MINEICSNDRGTPGIVNILTEWERQKLQRKRVNEIKSRSRKRKKIMRQALWKNLILPWAHHVSINREKIRWWGKVA